mmetsp:Transcript_114469/g.319878  ORF Transcript_114469/g.319878 Transcript_114469/m.319878 type:complete len:305 (-) Transcript_114469:424-1338(-)
MAGEVGARLGAGLVEGAHRQLRRLRNQRALHGRPHPRSPRRGQRPAVWAHRGLLRRRAHPRGGRRGRLRLARRRRDAPRLEAQGLGAGDPRLGGALREAGHRVRRRPVEVPLPGRPEGRPLLLQASRGRGGNRHWRGLHVGGAEDERPGEAVRLLRQLQQQRHGRLQARARRLGAGEAHACVELAHRRGPGGRCQQRELVQVGRRRGHGQLGGGLALDAARAEVLVPALPRGAQEAGRGRVRGAAGLAHEIGVLHRRLRNRADRGGGRRGGRRNPGVLRERPRHSGLHRPREVPRLYWRCLHRD